MRRINRERAKELGLGPAAITTSWRCPKCLKRYKISVDLCSSPGCEGLKSKIFEDEYKTLRLAVGYLAEDGSVELWDDVKLEIPPEQG